MMPPASSQRKSEGSNVGERLMLKPPYAVSSTGLGTESPPNRRTRNIEIGVPSLEGYQTSSVSYLELSTADAEARIGLSSSAVSSGSTAASAKICGGDTYDMKTTTARGSRQRAAIETTDPMPGSAIDRRSW